MLIEQRHKEKGEIGWRGIRLLYQSGNVAREDRNDLRRIIREPKLPQFRRIEHVL